MARTRCPAISTASRLFGLLAGAGAMFAAPADATGTGRIVWVTSVQQRADGRYITFVEMNGTAGPYNWDTRTVKDVVGMSYVLAP